MSDRIRPSLEEFVEKEIKEAVVRHPYGVALDEISRLNRLSRKKDSEIRQLKQQVVDLAEALMSFAEDTHYWETLGHSND